MPRQNQGKGRGQHPLGVQRGPARVGSLEPTVQAESGEVARGPGQKPLPGPSADLGVATGSGALEGAGFACGSREATPVCPKKGLLTPWTGFGQVAGGGGEVGQPRVVASAGLQYVRSKWEAWLCPGYKDHTFFFF